MFFANLLFVLLLSFSPILVFSADDFLFSPARLLVRMTKESGAYSVFSLRKVNAKHSYYEDFHGLRGRYNGRIVSFQGKTLGNFFADGMQPILCIDGDSPEMNGCRVLPEGKVYLEIPWFPNGAAAEIYDPEGKKILTIDLRSVAECNENAVCEGKEMKESCPSDCSNAVVPPTDSSFGGTANQNGRNSSGSVTGTNQSGRGASTASSTMWVLVVIGLFFLALFGWFFFRRRRKQKTQESDGSQNFPGSSSSTPVEW